MAGASDLPDAAGQSFHNLFVLWEPGGDGLRTAVATFAGSILPLFPDSDTVGRPIASWLVLLMSLAQRMPSVTSPAQIPYGLLVVAADYVYRICWLGSKINDQSPQITTAQQTAILTSYNTNF